MMKGMGTRLSVLFFLFGFVVIESCHNKESNPLKGSPNHTTGNKATHLVAFDSTLIEAFYVKYPKLISYKKKVVEIYKKQGYNFLWMDRKGLKETAAVISNKINNLDRDGIASLVPYKPMFNALFQKQTNKPNLEIELFLTSYYLFYVDKVLLGIEDAKSKELGWFLPRKKLSYVAYLDSILADPTKIEEKHLIAQYYKLKEVLQKYRDIEKKGGWTSIKTEATFVSLKPNDSSIMIPQIRTRLFVSGDISNDSKSFVYDRELQKGLLNYKKRNGFNSDFVILPKHIASMNIPLSQRIKTIIVNMERCRWVSKDISKAKEYIVINIPSFKLIYFKDEKHALVSSVVVGKAMNETIIFSGELSYIVFDPYWNVPTSILNKEIIPAIKKDKNYLTKHNMEWHNGGVRQQPGIDNSLGLVKFIFPNNNNIYLHDTPAKNLFNAESKAFSHGCIRVEKPKELANLILKDDPKWTPEKIEEAMNKNKESWYALKHKIPVYIGYFTSWVDDKGTINFYKDIYDRDSRLEEMLLEDK